MAQPQKGRTKIIHLEGGEGDVALKLQGASEHSSQQYAHIRMLWSETQTVFPYHTFFSVKYVLVKKQCLGSLTLVPRKLPQCRQKQQYSRQGRSQSANEL